MQIEVKIDASQIENALAKILDAMKDTRPIRSAIGEIFLESTRERIRAEGPDSDGGPWQQLVLVFSFMGLLLFFLIFLSI